MPPAEAGVVEYRFGDCTVSTDTSRLDIDVIHGFLSQAYWCENIPRETLKRAIRNSICFGIYAAGRQAGFARVVTDRATYAYLADVFILEPYRGRGFSRRLMEVITSHPDLQGLRRWGLLTRDAHGLYRQFGFVSPAHPERHMEIADFDLYKRAAALQSNGK